MTSRWLRVVGHLKTQVSFAEYRLCYRALLQKRPIILRSLLIIGSNNQQALSNVIFRFTISRLLRNIGLFCKNRPIERVFSTKETYYCSRLPKISSLDLGFQIYGLRFRVSDLWFEIQGFRFKTSFFEDAHFCKKNHMYI